MIAPWSGQSGGRFLSDRRTASFSYSKLEYSCILWTLAIELYMSAKTVTKYWKHSRKTNELVIAKAIDDAAC